MAQTLQKTLRDLFLDRLRGQPVTVIASNGYMMHSILEDYDGYDCLFVKTAQYGDASQTVLVTNYVSVMPKGDIQDTKLFSYSRKNPGTGKKAEYLKNLLGKRVMAIAFNGYQLHGLLLAYDERDLVITINNNGRHDDILVCNYYTIVPQSTNNHQ